MTGEPAAMATEPESTEIRIELGDSLRINDDDLVRLRTSSEDHFVERKTFGDWKKDAIKTIVAFANSLPVGEPGFFFIGVRDDGEVDEKSQSLDSVQKTLADHLKSIYPPVSYFAKAMAEGNLAYLVVIVQGSADRPHFAGPSYIREGSQTKQASEDQFKELVAQRLSKVRELLKWKGRTVTVENVYRLPGKTQRSAAYLTLQACNQFFVTFSGKDFRRSIPLASLEISFDDKYDQLKVEVEA